MKNAICLICNKPNIIWFQFLSSFQHYDIYVIIDDNSINWKDKFSSFLNIHCIQIKEEECLSKGFINTCSITFHKKVAGWTKALYAFCFLLPIYKHIWFFEDDVYFYDENNLFNIDKQYPYSDLLSNKYEENMGDKKDWLWNRIKIEIPPPYYKAMICCIRMSFILLKKIKEYANEYKTLFFTEALFPTLCKTNKLIYVTPKELNTIFYRKLFLPKEINQTDIFHPIKNLTLHLQYRNS